MNSKNERGYGARIGNAEKLVTALQTFNNYQPQKPELSIAQINTQIAEIKTQNNLVATKKQAHSLAVENRLQVFEKDPNSIKKILSPINATVKVTYGRNAKEATNVAHIIEKMRGNNIIKANIADANSISQSYQSYNSKIQFFADLVTNITNYGTQYNPTNQNLSVPSLQVLYNNAITANNLVVDSYAQFALINDKRIADYANLAQNAIRIKDSVKAQYGQESVEYRLIKSLQI